MEKGVRISEREYSKKMADLNRGFEVRCMQTTRSGVDACARTLATRSLEWRAE